MSRGPSCSRDPEYKLIASLHLPPEIPFRSRHLDKSIQVQAKTSLGLWIQYMGDLLAALGYTHDGLVFGAVLELVNRFPNDVRRKLLTGIIEGRGLSLAIEGDTIVIDHPVIFDALGDKGEVRSPAGLWIPGKE